MLRFLLLSQTLLFITGTTTLSSSGTARPAMEIVSDQGAALWHCEMDGGRHDRSGIIDARDKLIAFRYGVPLFKWSGFLHVPDSCLVGGGRGVQNTFVSIFFLILKMSCITLLLNVVQIYHNWSLAEMLFETGAAR